MIDIKKQREIIEAVASKPPWVIDSWYEGHQNIPEVIGDSYCEKEDAEFIIAARTMWPEALDELEKFRECAKALYVSFENISQNKILFKQKIIEHFVGLVMLP